MPYAPEPERVYFGDVPKTRGEARRACASHKAEYAWLDVDVCLSRPAVRRPHLPAIQSGAAASAFLHEIYPVASLDREVLFVLCLSSKLVPIGLAVPHKGGLASTFVEIKTVFKAALLLPTSGIIYAHNHPSEDPTPSQEDKEMTERLKQAGAIIGIRFYDHIVLTNDPKKFYSFSEHHGSLVGLGEAKPSEHPAVRKLGDAFEAFRRAVVEASEAVDETPCRQARDVIATAARLGRKIQDARRSVLNAYKDPGREGEISYADMRYEETETAERALARIMGRFRERCS